MHILSTSLDRDTEEQSYPYYNLLLHVHIAPGECLLTLTSHKLHKNSFRYRPRFLKTRSLPKGSSYHARTFFESAPGEEFSIGSHCRKYKQDHNSDHEIQYSLHQLHTSRIHHKVPSNTDQEDNENVLLN
ncbi:hypothetical protein D3C85_1410140 [compost metagenome]